MSSLLSLFALISAGGLLALFHAVRSAPEGHEDADGFHSADGDEVNPELCLIPVTRK